MMQSVRPGWRVKLLGELCSKSDGLKSRSVRWMSLVALRSLARMMMASSVIQLTRMRLAARCVLGVSMSKVMISRPMRMSP